jgi:hypothetical protein
MRSCGFGNCEEIVEEKRREKREEGRGWNFLNGVGEILVT